MDGRQAGVASKDQIQYMSRSNNAKWDIASLQNIYQSITYFEEAFEGSWSPTR